MKRGDLVQLVWIDSYSPLLNGWEKEDGYLEDNVGCEFQIYSVGYLIHKDKDYYTISGCVTDQADKFETMVNRVIRIPVKCVKAVKCLDLSGIKKLKGVRT